MSHGVLLLFMNENNELLVHIAMNDSQEHYVESVKSDSKQRIPLFHYYFIYVRFWSM